MTDAVYPACMHAVSAICLWATVLVCNSNICLSALLSRLHAALRCAGYRISAHFTMQCADIYARSVDGCLVDILYTQPAKALQKCPCVRSNGCTRVSVTSRTLLSRTTASTNGWPKPTLLPVLRYTNQTQHWPKLGSWTLVYTHRSSNNHRSHVITQIQPRPNGPLALYVHTQETVDHTSLRVAVCSTTVVSRLSVHVRLS